jgi:ubiquinone/menaquinone biosynthesis C-methylase UbiE
VKLEQTQQAWERHAEGYDKALTATDMLAAQEALRMAGVSAGARLLDIAAGPGALSIPAARLGADVLAVDYSHAMVELLSGKAKALGLTNLRTRLMDGMALELDDASFDVACSELGIMLFPDRAKGLREMARVVAPGGRGVMVALGPPQRVEAVWLFFQAMQQELRGFVPLRDSPLFCLQDLDDLAREMEQAGFRDVRVAPFDSRLDVESGDHLWEAIMAGAPAIQGLMRTVPDEGRHAVRRALVDLVGARSGGAGTVPLRMRFNIGVGTKPATSA